MEENKTYRLMLNGQDIEIDAKEMTIARKRMAMIIKTILPEHGGKKTLRRFWTEMIVLNIMTTKILKQVSPYELGKILNPKENGDDDSWQEILPKKKEGGQGQ